MAYTTAILPHGHDMAKFSSIFGVSYTIPALIRMKSVVKPFMPNFIWSK